MTEPSERFCFDLSDSFSCYIKIKTDFLKCKTISVVKTESHTKNFLFTGRERSKNRSEIFLKKRICCLVCRVLCFLIHDKVPKKTVLFLSDRSFKRNRLAGNILYLLNARYRPAELLVYFFVIRLASEFLHKLAAFAYNLVYLLYHVHRNTYCSCLIAYRARDCLAYPPCSIRTEFISLAVFKFFDCLDQTDVSFLNKIKELQTAVRVFFSDRYYKTKVCIDKTILCMLHHNSAAVNFFCHRQNF